jgi:acyl-CoA synthetase (AMP-forming)/AMP-acid ligase II
LTSYELNSITKTNETGYPIPGVEVKIVDPETKETVKKGERGIIHITSAASADRYLDNEEATNEYYYYEGEKKWANLGDIAVQNDDGSYNMLGRSSDSYVDENGEIHYLFDIEYALSTQDPVIEWEISVFKNGTKNDVVAQIVIKDEYKGRECEVIEYLFKKYPIQGVKIYDSFEVSEVTGKRNYKLLKSDQEGYISPYDDEHMIISSYINGKKVEEVIPKVSLNTNIKTLKKSI